MTCVARKKIEKLPYCGLITLIFRANGIIINDDLKADKLANVEIEKETLKKMMIGLISTVWVNQPMKSSMRDMEMMKSLSEPFKQD